jgi:hypothetical protein
MGDRPKMITFDTTLMFALPTAKGNRMCVGYGDKQLSRREYLESKLSSLAGGFTCIEAKGVWRTVPEPVYLYMVAVPQAHVDAVLDLIVDVAYDEEAIFVTVNGVTALLIPPAGEVQDAA